MIEAAPPPFLIKITIPRVSQISPPGRIARAKKSKPDTRATYTNKSVEMRISVAHKKQQKALAQKKKQPLDSFAFQLNEKRNGL